MPFFLQSIKQSDDAFLIQSLRSKSFVLIGILVIMGMSSFGLSAQQVVSMDHFVVKNQPLSEVIRQLSKESHLNFTYDASDPVMETIISYEAYDKSAWAILSEILMNTQRSYKQIGNQIVIYQVEANTDDVVPVIISPRITKPEASPPISVKEEKEIPLTSLSSPRNIYDTIFINDTILLVDTLRIIDTVFIAKNHSNGSLKKMPVLQVDYFVENAFRTPGWALGLSVSPMLSNFNTTQKQDDWSLRSFALDAQMTRYQKRWSFSLGVQWSHFAQKYNHTYDITTGGYYQIDTLDVYYTVVGMDTTWVSVTDSSYLPLDSETFSYDKTNRVGYIGLKAELEYMLVHRPVFGLSAKAGFSIGSLIYREGLLLDEGNPAEGIKYSDLNFSSPLLGVLVGVSSHFRINDQFDMRVEAFYLQFIDDIVQQPEYDNRLSAVGVSFGIRYYLK